MDPIQLLEKLFSSSSNPVRSVEMSAYMKNNFPFVGIPTPARRALEKERMKSFSCEAREEVKKISIDLWKKEEREFHYASVALLMKYKKLRIEESIEHFEWLLTHKSRWDSVDTIDTKLVGEYFLLYPEKKKSIVLTRAKSDNMRLQRTAIQFQLMYKTKTDTALLEKIFEHTHMSKEFFVQKAMGRMLREYSKTDPKRVKHHITTHPLSKLTIREGSKYI